jgi:CheY-like chemotaxis protein
LSCILIVEDDFIVRETISDALIDAGYAVAKASDQLRDHPPDAILLDLMMPVMDGWTFLDDIHQDDALVRIPVGILSAAPAVRQEAIAQGVRVAVGKPFTLEELLEQVECLLDAVPSRNR